MLTKPRNDPMLSESSSNDSGIAFRFPRSSHYHHINRSKVADGPKVQHPLNADRQQAVLAPMRALCNRQGGQPLPSVTPF